MSDLLIEPWRKPEAKPDITEAIADAADRVTAVRVVIQREKRLSLAGKMAALTERANDFTRDTEKVLDGIAEKITRRRKSSAISRSKSTTATTTASSRASTIQSRQSIGCPTALCPKVERARRCTSARSSFSVTVRSTRNTRVR